MDFCILIWHTDVFRLSNQARFMAQAPSRHNESEFVTYKVMLGWLIGSGAGWASIVVSVGWVAWQIHGAQSHPDAASTKQVQREVTHIREIMAANLRTIQIQTDRIEKKLDTLMHQK